MLCRMCNNEKLPADFYAGMATRCKDCHKAAMKLRRMTNSSVQEYDRKRAKTPGRRKHSRRISLQWRKDHPEAYRALTAVGNAIRDKRLFKGLCAICGTSKLVWGHHKDYAKPLDVVWLCAKCRHRIRVTFPELSGHFEGPSCR